MLKNKFFFVLAMIKPTNLPDTTITYYRNSLDHITDYEKDQDVPEDILPPDWLAELRERMSR